MSEMLVMPVEVRATNGRGHTPEEWLEMLMAKLMYISDSCPDPIRTQANAFKAKIAGEIMWHMREAIRSDRLTLCNKLREAGHPEVADLIWGM